MNLKNACKIGLFMSVLSVVLLFIAYLLNAWVNALTYFRFYDPYLAAYGLPDYQPVSLFLRYLVDSLMQDANFGCYLIGFIFLLLGIRKPHYRRTVTAKVSCVIAATLFGIGAAYVTWQNVHFYDFIDDVSLLESVVLRLLIYNISIVLCGVSLCIFVSINTKKNVARIAAVAAILSHCLLYFFETLEVACILYHFLKFKTSDIGSLITKLQLAYLTAYYIGIFLWIAAVLLFLLTWLRQKPWPPMAGVAEPSPEPAPVLSAEESLPEQ